MRILVVDDSPPMRRIITTILRKAGYDVEEAEDGVEAWNLLRVNGARFVVCDWQMPRMDGLELARRIREAKFENYIYFILLTARDQKSDLVAGLDAGADDFFSKPVNKDELLVRIRAGKRILDLEHGLEERNRKLNEAHDKLQIAYATIEKDLQSAATMQRALLPEPATLGAILFDWLYYPSLFVAGDMFGYYCLDGNERYIGFYHLDVAGHGIPASLLSFTLNKVLLPSRGESSIVSRADDASGLGSGDGDTFVPPELVVAGLNETFQGQGSSAMQYFTMVYGVIDLETRRLTFCQAGHPYPMLLKRAEGRVNPVGIAGVPVGMVPGINYESTTQDLDKGDRLFLYSDGITECENVKGEAFGEEQLRRLLQDGIDLPLGEVKERLGGALRAWKGDDSYKDDVTLLALEWTGS
ncbi:MAG: SpoIIE family protein phosphatase [Pseudomonadota bacterium]|nr:SpoIIE family protein phosphatase [Pseudomonadota bacterium]